MFKVGSAAFLRHGGFPPQQDDHDKKFADRLAQVQFWDAASVGRAYRELTKLPFLEATWDRFVHRGHKADNLKAVVTLAFHKHAMEEGKNPVNVPGDYPLALLTLAGNLSPMGEAALRQSLPPEHDNNATPNAFTQYLALPHRHQLAALIHLAQGGAHAPSSPACANANNAAAKAYAAAAKEFANHLFCADLAEDTRRRGADAELACGLAHWHGGRAAPAVMAYLSALDTFTALALPEPAARAGEALNTIAAAVAMQGDTQALLEALAKLGATAKEFETLVCLYDAAGRRSLAKTAYFYARRAYELREEDEAAKRAFVHADALDLAGAASERIARAAEKTAGRRASTGGPPVPLEAGYSEAPDARVERSTQQAAKQGAGRPLPPPAAGVG
ncbi:hypothetical protein [Pandoraea oxalativorans]|uniref:Uncharacterized protein n=1 Tax=Pandoraea oxalativorans TaxID=573737 RepID=A0A0G3IEA5_9BURK|nr:hypothetical protein [Pandoraea oxalativorans]AKK24883.1 hypothetical protein MB84_29400 [Pandoraea oxalativorans]